MSEKAIGLVNPARVEGLSNEEVVSIATSNTHMLALTARGTVYAWGHNRVIEDSEVSGTLQTSESKKSMRALHKISFKDGVDSPRKRSLGEPGGILGTGDNDPTVNQPKPIEETSDKKIVQIAAGDGFSLFVTHSGEVSIRILSPFFFLACS
jgi:alpha-tubulin suppressor-like RCC1 family protein